MHGVLLVDKAVGEGSTDVVRMVKKAFNTKKVGHTGTLDPFATGLLPICLGESLKYSRWLLDATKTYDFTLALGKQTDTADHTGDIMTEMGVPDSLDLTSVLAHFQGDISQIPPKFSALKVNGKRAYDLARAGEAVELVSRQVTIHDLSLERVDRVTLKGSATVSKGTYIRTLCEDIAKHLGTVGHCSALRRTVVSPYHIEHEKVVTTETLKQWFERTDKSELASQLLPIDSLCQQFPALEVDDIVIEMLRQGKRINQLGKDGLLRLYAKNRQFVGLGEQKADQLRPFRLMRY